MDDTRFIQWTGERTPPAGLLARLRQIHPKAELVDCGAEWWLGLVEPNTYRYRTGARILRRTMRQGNPSPDTVRFGQLLVQGFTLVAKYPQADGAMVEDFRRRCWQHDHEPDKSEWAMALREEASADEHRKAKWHQIIREGAREACQILRGRMNALVNGQRDLGKPGPAPS